MDRALATVDELIRKVRGLAAGLRPAALDHLGLCSALEILAAEFESMSDIHCDTSLEIEAEPLLGERGIDLYRICQEALANVARHSGAGRVSISFARDGADLVLEIVDDGLGMSRGSATDPKSMGLVNMRERVAELRGEFRIETPETGGTRISLRIPAIEPAGVVLPLFGDRAS
jgi:signal transduction histidine kinase